MRKGKAKKKKKKGLRWCQGEVVGDIKERAKPTVMVLWDKLSDVEGKAGAVVRSEQMLLQSKWNKDVEGAWRLDVGIEICDKNKDENGSGVRDGFKISGVQSESICSSSNNGRESSNDRND